MILYSEERCLGKTTFAKCLVGGELEEDNFIYCRNTLSADNFKNKPNAKLLMLLGNLDKSITTLQEALMCCSKLSYLLGQNNPIKNILVKKLSRAFQKKYDSDKI